MLSAYRSWYVWAFVCVCVCVPCTGNASISKDPSPVSSDCNTLQHTATYCNTMQQTATHCNTLPHTAKDPSPVSSELFPTSFIECFHIFIIRILISFGPCCISFWTMFCSLIQYGPKDTENSFPNLFNKTYTW